jgi:cytoskeletal protein CcmA (bactofilin family)
MAKLTLGSDKQERADLAGLAALVASGAYAVSEDGKAVTAQDSTVAYCPDTAGTSPINAVCQGDKGAIVMLSRNLSAADRWLRVDHGNVMQNVLEFRTGDPTPASQADIQAIDSVSRQIRNVARIYNLGSGNSNGESDNLYLGKKYGDAAKAMVTLPNNAVVVDADQEVLGKLVVAATIDAKGNISTDGDLISKKNADIKGNINVGADAQIGKSLTVSGQTRSVGSLYTDGQLSSKGSAFIEGALQANQKITGLGSLDIKQDGVFGGNVRASNINSDGNINGASIYSRSLSVSGGGSFGSAIYAPKIIDSDDNYYEIDPASTSKMNTIAASSITSNRLDVNERLNANEYLYIGGLAIEGGKCDKNGLVGKTSEGELVSCKNGAWEKTGSEKKWRVASGSVVYRKNAFNRFGHSYNCAINKTSSDSDIYIFPEQDANNNSQAIFAPININGVHLLSVIKGSTSVNAGSHTVTETTISKGGIEVTDTYVYLGSGKCPKVFIR